MRRSSSAACRSCHSFTGVHDRYHKATDNPHNVDTAKLERIARTAFVTAWLLADAPIRPVIDRPARIEFQP